MTKKVWLSCAVWVVLTGCGGDDGAPADANAAGACPSGEGKGMLAVDVTIDDGVEADVGVVSGGEEEDSIAHSAMLSLSAGSYGVHARRVRQAGAIVGAAFQPAVQESGDVCVRSGKTATVHVVYTREPGSAKLWLTQTNGDGAQVQAYDADQLASRGDQTPSASLSPKLNNVGAIRVDGKGRLWIGTNTGKLVAYNASHLGSSGSAAPDIVLDGPSLCEAETPCGPNAIAFDREGGLWVSTLHRIVKFAAGSYGASGQPSAAVTIHSADAPDPRALAFDQQQNLWVGDAGGALLKFAAARLARDITGAADVAIFAQQPGPVMIGLGDPEGLAIDADDKVWVGYFGGNDLVRFDKSELAHSAPVDAPIVPKMHVKVGVEAVLTDLALDEAGNLWLPGGAGSIYRIANDQFSADEPALERLHSAEIGSVERMAFNTVPGSLFIQP
jgi:sugar lactone lactonase YvrE